MASKIDNLKWKLWQKKRDVLADYGLIVGLIKPYDDSLIEKLRDVNYGGIPASIMLLSDRGVSHQCYDRALLISHAFKNDDFRMVDADIDGITLNPKYIDYFGKTTPHYGNHCFIERTDENGVTWVYDTTKMLVYEKILYYLIENPKITSINDKETVMSYCEFVDVENSSLEHDKYAAPLLLPMLEQQVAGQRSYADVLEREIALYKKRINYDSLCAELPSYKQYKKTTTNNN